MIAEYRLFKELWAFRDNRIAVACINDVPIREHERTFYWPLGRRPGDHPGSSDFNGRP